MTIKWLNEQVKKILTVFLMSVPSAKLPKDLRRAYSPEQVWRYPPVWGIGIGDFVICKKRTYGTSGFFRPEYYNSSSKSSVCAILSIHETPL